jgi:hypothetical protein
VNGTLVQVLVVALFALSCGALMVAWMQRRLELAAGVLLGVALVVWVIDFAAIVTGFGDADSFVVCTEDCGGVHYSVVIGFLAPPLLMALAAFAGIVALEQRRRAKRAQ